MGPFKRILEMQNNSQLTDIATEKTSCGVYTGLGVTAQGTPDMTVAVATGTIYMANGNRWTPAAVAALAITTADATNPRWDIVYVSALGVVSYLAGTAAASPSVPSVPTGGQKLAEIYVAAEDTAIGATEIYDKRRIDMQQEWITPTLENSWVNYGGGEETCQYMKDQMGFVHIKGLITGGLASVNIFTLPVGYRPLRIVTIGVAATGAMGTIGICANGSIALQSGTPTWVSFNGITFRAEA